MEREREREIEREELGQTNGRRQKVRNMDIA